MECRYTYRWGFVVRVPKDEEYHYVYKWGFVFREKKKLESDFIRGWQDYRFHQGGVVDVWKYDDIVALSADQTFLKKCIDTRVF